METQPAADEANDATSTSPASPLSVSKASFDPETRLITLEMRGGYSVFFRPERAQGLGTASVEDLSEIQIESSGESIYFPRLDADFSVPNLLKGRFGNDRWEADWLAAHAPEKAA